MRRIIKRCVGWFLPPDAAAVDRRAVLGGPYDPDNLRVVLNISVQEHRDLLDGIDRLDRKLLAVITVGGAYAAILISIRDTISLLAITLSGLLAVIGIGIAYAGWRTHPRPSVSSADFIDTMWRHPDDLRRLAIVANVEANQEVLRFIVLKGRMFRGSWVCFSLGALSTMTYTVVRGFW